MQATWSGCVLKRPRVSISFEPEPGSRHDRRHALDVGQVRIRAMLEQQACRLDVAGLGGTQQRRRAHGEHHVGAAIRTHRAIRREELQLRVRVRARHRAGS